MNTFDWNEMSQVPEENFSLFAYEFYSNSVKEMYNRIVMDDTIDNEEIVASFRHWCDKIRVLRVLFLCWSQEQKRDAGSITHTDVLQFINHLAYSHEAKYMEVRDKSLAQ